MVDGYKVTSVHFSPITKIENSEEEDGVVQRYDEITYIILQVSFVYNLGGEEYAGTVPGEELPLGKVHYEQTAIGLSAVEYTLLANIDFSDIDAFREELNALADSIAETEYNSICVKAKADSANKSLLAKINDEVSFDLEAGISFVDGYRYLNNYEYQDPDDPTSAVETLYPELFEWTTHIGDNKINQSFKETTQDNPNT